MVKIQIISNKIYVLPYEIHKQRLIFEKKQKLHTWYLFHENRR